MDGRVSRPRLTTVATLVAAVVGAALAAGLFALVRAERLRDSLNRARTEAAFDLKLAGPLLERSTDLQQAVESYEDRGIHAVLIADGRRFASDPSVEVAIPEDLRVVVSGGKLGYERLDVAETPTLVVGGPTPDRGAELYFFFSEATIREDLAQLATALVVGWVAIVVIAFVFGRAAAARIATLAEAETWGRRFTSNVSHELPTPVAALVSEASVLEASLDRIPPEARRAAELLVADVGRLRRLVEDLTSLASLDARREELHLESFDLGRLVAGTVRSRGWDDLVAIRSDSVAVDSDRSRVDRIVANLVGNALQHGGSDVEVRVGREGESAFVEVADRGPGISPEDLPRVFDRFFRADPARAGPGSGLGLAIAREDALLLGGDVEVWSELGVGSRFTFHLPVSDPTVGRVAEPLREGGSRVAAAPEDGERPEHEGGAP